MMVTVGQLLKWFGVLLVLAVLCLGGYVWYRYHAASAFMQNASNIKNLSTARQILAYVKGLPPIRCQSVVTNFSGALHNVIYVANDVYRETIEDVSGRDSETGNTLQILVNQSGFYAWRSGGDSAK